LETEVTGDVRRRVAHSLGVPEEQIHCTLDGNVVVVTVTGQLHGRSAKNATRRRQQAVRVAKRVTANRNLELSITFAMHDAVSTMEDLVRTTTAFVLGNAPEAVHINVGRTGKTSVLVAMARVDDDAKAQLTRVISPLLQSAGLSLDAVSLVSPMREDVSDARLLRAAKILAPCDGAAVARRLKQMDDIDIPADLVHRRLDVLRQKGLLVYLGDRRFALTLRGLAVVPIATNRRDSSDVERVLALAKSKW
jgi:preprotein translocase subunit SecD